MLRFLFTRFGLLIPTFLGVTVVAFGFIRMIPGSNRHIVDIGLLNIVLIFRIDDKGKHIPGRTEAHVTFDQITLDLLISMNSLRTNTTE